MSIPVVATVESLLAYLEWHLQNGRGDDSVIIDRRGLEYLKPDRHETVGIGMPPSGETHGNNQVFLRAIF